MARETNLPKRPPREQRLQWLDGQLRAKKYPTPGEMCEMFGISERTAYADIKHLRDDLGATVSHSAENGGWYYIEPPQWLPLPVITPTETGMLRRALLVAREYLGDAECAALQRLSDHIGAHVPDAKPSAYESARGASHLLQPTPPSLLLDIQNARIERQKMHIRYKSPRTEGVTERIVRPYHMDNVQGEWYLIAHCEVRGDIRTFHTARIQHYTVLPQPGDYEIPPDFNAQAELRRGLLHETGGTVETVVLDFDAYQTAWIRERSIHPTETREELAGGGLRITLQIPVGDEVKRWLLGYGRHVTVREPHALRREMADEIAALQKIYDYFSPDADTATISQ